MLRNVLINRWILGSVVLLIIVAVSCIFWYQHETSPDEEEVAKADEVVRQKQITNETETDNMTEDKTDSPARGVSTDDISTDKGKVSDADIEKILNDTAAEGKISDVDVEKILKAIVAEEKQVEEALSPEETRKIEMKKRVEEIRKEMVQIITKAGGKLHAATHPIEMGQILKLQGEMIALHREAEGETDPILGFIHDLSVMTHNNLNSQGELSVSGASKIAEYISDTGDVDTAQRMQDLIQIVLDSGDDVIKPEHIETFQKNLQ